MGMSKVGKKGLTTVPAVVRKVLGIEGGISLFGRLIRIGVLFWLGLLRTPLGILRVNIVVMS